MFILILNKRNPFSFSLSLSFSLSQSHSFGNHSAWSPFLLQIKVFFGRQPSLVQFLTHRGVNSLQINKETICWVTKPRRVSIPPDRNRLIFPTHRSRCGCRETRDILLALRSRKSWSDCGHNQLTKEAGRSLIYLSSGCSACVIKGQFHWGSIK